MKPPIAYSNAKIFSNTAKYGKYYNPASAHYGPNTVVTCDKCQRTNLKTCVGYESYDLCLSCCETIVEIDHALKTKTTLFPGTFEEELTGPPVTYMAGSIYNPTFGTSSPSIGLRSYADSSCDTGSNQSVVSSMRTALYNMKNKKN